MEPLRKCQQATHWRECNEDCVYTPGGAKLTPCGASDPGARAMKLYDIPPDQQGRVQPPKTSMADFEKAMSHSSTSVAEDELEQFVSWTAEFGQDGSG